MSDFIESALLRSPGGSSPWLAAINARGKEGVEGKSLPNFKVEEWKYTSLRALKDADFAAAPQAWVDTHSLADCYTVEGLDALRLVFVDGQFSASLSDSVDLPEGVTLQPFSQASSETTSSIQQYLGTLAEPESGVFSALNASWLSDGVFLRVAKGVCLDKPIQIVWVSSETSASFGISQRLLVVVEEDAEATVIEHFAGAEKAPSHFCNGITELFVKDKARLNHYRLHLEQADAIHVGAVHAELQAAATLNGFHMAMGSRVKRIDINVAHRGEGAHCELNGVYLPRNKEHVDYHTTQEHAAPECTSEENFRGIISDQARAVFNGRIHIHPGARKTEAHLSNKNLLTSDKAEIDTKPELEIYNDDVICSHGATVAQLDSTQLHYLRTRGVSAQEARVLLSFGFINELIAEIDHEPLQQYLRPKLAELFAQDPELARHLL